MKEYSVSGMTCAACSSRVENATKSVSGVKSCSVSLLTGTMTVDGDFDENILKEKVVRAGYGIAEKGKEKKTAEEKKESPFSSLIASLVLLLFLMYLSMGHMLSLPLPAWFNPVSQGICQMLLSLWILLIHRRFFERGFKALLHLSPNMDTLVSLGAGVSFLYSLFLVFLMTGKDTGGQAHLLHSLYFESAAMILVLISFGKMLEEKSKGKTTSAIRALQKLSPDTARVIRGGEEIEISLEEVKVGDFVRVLPGESIPVDGVVKEGEGAVDESALTGESVPADKTVGDAVFTGTVNLSSPIVICAEKVGKETTLSRMIERVISASASKAPIARLADRVAGIFVPVVMGISLITFLLWMLFDGTFSTALTHGIAVLVVSCPCALGLATPTAIMVANGVSARHNVLFKTAASLEAAGKTKIVVLDKTGTVTTGKMRVSDVIPSQGIGEEELVKLVYSLEEGSLHPIATALKEYAQEKELSPYRVSAFQTFAGFGVQGEIEGKKALCGKADLIRRETKIPKEAEKEALRLSEEGKTVMFFSLESIFCGMIAVSDTVKEDSEKAVSEMKKMGLRVIMITGDRRETAESIAKKVGIDEVMASVLPDGKEEAVRNLKKEGKVLMVGDGINDAPALTASDVGVAIGAGMDVAMDASEVVLMKNSLSDVPSLIRLSRKTLQNIKENLFWAFCYNIIGIPLAAGAFVSIWGWHLTPMFGAAAMSFSSIVVVTNALRLNLFSWSENEKKSKEKKMEKVLKIEGMMCPHCEAHVKKALEAIEGVEEAIPSHEKKEAIVRLSAEVSDDILKETVEKEGYKVL